MTFKRKRDLDLIQREWAAIVKEIAITHGIEIHIPSAQNALQKVISDTVEDLIFQRLRDWRADDLFQLNEYLELIKSGKQADTVDKEPQPKKRRRTNADNFDKN